MSTTFVPPKPDQWEGPAQQTGGFTPPSPDQWEGPARGAISAPSIPGMEKLGGTAPSPAKVPLPGDLDPNYATPSTFVNPRTGKRGTNQAPGKGGGPLGILDTPITGAQKMAAGVAQMAEPGFDEKAGGASKVIRGAMEASTPLLPVAAATAPIRVAAGLAAGYGAGKITHGAMKAVGASDNAADLGEDVAGLAAGGAAAKRAPGAIADTRAAIGEKFARDPKTSMVKALKPASTNTGFTSHLDRSLPELKATEPELGRKIENVGDLIEAIEAAKKRVWAQYRGISEQPSIDPYTQKPTAGTRAESQYDMSPVADAMESTISPKLRRENPKATQSIAVLANKYRTPMTLQEAESILKSTNAELDGYYAKYPPAQRKALAANPQVAVKEAQASALRDTIYSALDAEGEGSAPRELKQRYGALMNLEKEAYRRQNVADRQQPDSLSEQFGKWSGVGKVVKGLVTMNPADVAMGVAESKAAKWIKDQQTTDALIKSALANYKGTPTPVVEPAPFRPKALLTTGDIAPPPPEDTSYVRSAPGMAQPPNPRRAIGAGRGTIVTPPPTDTSGINVATGEPLRAPVSRQLPAGPSVRPPSDLSGPAGDVTDLIPIKDPVTGRIQYVPRPQKVSGAINLPRYAKGGIIRRPTLLVDAATKQPTGIMAEAGPEKIVPMKGETAAVSTVPEKPDAIAEQLDQLTGRKRRVVMIPRGTFPHAAPEGMVTHNDQHGNRFIFNPHLIGIHDIKVAVAMNRLPSILGAARGGMGAPDKSKLRGGVVNVAARSPKGFTLQSTATDKPHLSVAIKQSAKILPKGGKISIESPEKEIARRVRA